MIKRKILIVLAIISIVIAGACAVSAESSLKTHEYNFADKAFFNISDDLTNESEFMLSSGETLDVGNFYAYPDEKVICALWFVGEDGVTDFEAHTEDAAYEEIESNSTSQGYKVYIFKDSQEYDVYIDLNNLTVTFDDGTEMPYLYFSGSFETLDEAQIFVDTFKISETAKVTTNN